MTILDDVLSIKCIHEGHQWTYRKAEALHYRVCLRCEKLGVPDTVIDNIKNCIDEKTGETNYGYP